MPDLSDFASMVGNLKLFLIYLVLLSTLAALGEEVDYRGYLMNRVAGVFGETKVGWIVSLVVVSVVFGCGHIDQGGDSDVRECLERAAARGTLSGLRPESHGAGHCTCYVGYPGF